MNETRFLAAWMLVLGIAIVNCGGDDEAATTSTTAATTGTGSTTTTTGTGGTGGTGGAGGTMASTGGGGGTGRCLATEENTGPTSACTTVNQGDLEITEPNTVIEGYCIEGGSIIIGPNATNVVVRNTEIRSVGFAGGFYSSDEDLRGLLVEDTYVDCQLGGGSSGIGGSNWTGHRVEIRNCENGINIGSNIVLTNSLIHMPNNEGEAHADGIQIYESSHDDLIECSVIHFPLASSSLQFHTSSGPQNHDIKVRYNTFLGGAYVVRVPGDNPSCQPPNPSCGPWDNLEFYGNRVDVLDPNQEYGLCSGDPDSIEVWGDPTGEHPENDNVVDGTGVVIPSCVGQL